MDWDQAQAWWPYLITTVVIYYLGLAAYSNPRLPIVLFEEKEVDSTNIDEAEAPESGQEELLNRIQSFLDLEKPYLNPDLSLSELSSRSGISKNQLSQLINDGLGLNFNQLINRRRIQHFQYLLEQGKEKELNILGMALSCGFNSKATFNRVFKQETGKTPRQYIKDFERQV